MDHLRPREGRARPAEGLPLTSSEEEEFAAALDGPLYRSSRVCRPVLQRLDETLTSGGAEYDEPVVSIEHVLPQTVEEGSEWATLFPDPEEREGWTHRLANLVLLTRRINTRASNWPFARKKTEYFNGKFGMSPFPLTQGVQHCETWGPDILRDRQRTLMKHLCEVWRLPVPDH
jgi:hypothetical protein